MGFIVKSYDNLKNDFDKIVGDLLQQHKLAIDQEDKLSEPRKGQVKFLRASIAKLDKPNLKDDNKAHILTGLMLVIREVIENSYTHRSPDKSGFYSLLPDAMGITEENQLSHKDRIELADRAKFFIMAQVFPGHREMKVDHPYASINGFGFKTDNGIKSLEEIWKTANELACKANNASFDEAARQTQQALKEPKASGGFMSAFWRSEKTTAVEEKVPAEVTAPAEETTVPGPNQ